MPSKSIAAKLAILAETQSFRKISAEISAATDVFLSPNTIARLSRGGTPSRISAAALERYFAPKEADALVAPTPRSTRARGRKTGRPLRRVPA